MTRLPLIVLMAGLLSLGCRFQEEEPSSVRVMVPTTDPDAPAKFELSLDLPSKSTQLAPNDTGDPILVDTGPSIVISFSSPDTQHATDAVPSR